MNEPHKRVVHVDRDVTPGQAGVPEDLRQETAKRLALLCGIGAAIWLIEIVMASALPPASVATAFPWPGNLVGGVMAAALIACAFHVRRRAMHDSCAMLDL